MVRIEQDGYKIELQKVMDYRGVAGAIKKIVNGRREDLNTKDIKKLIENAFRWEELKEISPLLNELNLLKVE